MQVIKKALVSFHSKSLSNRPAYLSQMPGEMWFDKLTTLRKLEGRIISFIDQPGVIKKILQHIGLWEESHARKRPSDRTESYSLSQIRHRASTDQP
jgi:hypothetical protein